MHYSLMAAKLKATAIDPPWTLRLANTIKLIYSEAMSMLNKKQQNAKRDNLPNPISWRIAQIEAVFANACRNAMLDKPVHITSQSLKGADLELSGVAAEGAAMGLAMLDRLTPWTKDRWQQFWLCCKDWPKNLRRVMTRVSPSGFLIMQPQIHP